MLNQLNKILQEDGHDRLRRFLGDFQNLNTQEREMDLFTQVRFVPVLSNDFLSITVVPPPFVQASINSGTLNTNASISKDHPGNLLINASTSANSGGRTQTERDIQIGGGEGFELIFQLHNTLSTVAIRFGFHDTQTVADATDGVYFEISSGTLKGKTATNSSRSTTATTFTPSLNTWYRGRITIAPNPAQGATFALYDSEADLLLWSDSLSSNLPVGAGRTAPVNVVATRNTMTTGGIVELDLIAFGWHGRKLAR